MSNKARENSKPGPKEERVKVEGDWEDVAKKAIKKPKPKNGWFEPEKNRGKDKD